MSKPWDTVIIYTCGVCHTIQLFVSLNIWTLQLLITKWFLKGNFDLPVQSSYPNFQHMLLSTCSTDCTRFSKSYSYAENLNVLTDTKNAEKLSSCICLNMPENKEGNVVIQRLS